MFWCCWISAAFRSQYLKCQTRAVGHIRTTNSFSTFASSSASLSRSLPQGSVRSYLICFVQILRSCKGHFHDIMIHIFSCLCSLSISLMAPSPHLLNPHSNVTQTTPSTVSKLFNSFLFFDCVLN